MTLLAIIAALVLVGLAIARMIDWILDAAAAALASADRHDGIAEPRDEHADTYGIGSDSFAGAGFDHGEES